MRSFLKISIFLSILWLAACDRTNDSAHFDNIEKINSKLLQLSAGIVELQKSSEELKKEMVELRVQNIQEAIKKASHSIAFLIRVQRVSKLLIRM